MMPTGDFGLTPLIDVCRMGDPCAGRADVARLRRRVERAEREDGRDYLFPPRGQRGPGVPLEITSAALARALRVRDRDAEAAELHSDERARERHGDVAKIRAIGEALVITAERLDDHETRIRRLEGRTAARAARRSPAEARRVARRLLAAGCSRRLAAKAMGVSDWQIREMVRGHARNSHNTNDSAALAVQNMGSETNAETRIDTD